METNSLLCVWCEKTWKWSLICLLFIVVRRVLGSVVLRRQFQGGKAPFCRVWVSVAVVSRWRSSCSQMNKDLQVVLPPWALHHPLHPDALPVGLLIGRKRSATASRSWATVQERSGRASVKVCYNLSWRIFTPQLANLQSSSRSFSIISWFLLATPAFLL